MTPYLDALARPTFPGWPEPSAQTKATTEALLAALVPLLAPVKPHVGSASHAEHVVDVCFGDRILAFYVLDETVDYHQSDYADWNVAEGLLDDEGRLRELVAWLLGTG